MRRIYRFLPANLVLLLDKALGVFAAYRGRHEIVPVALALSIRTTADAVLLEVAGRAGQVVEIQRTSSLPAAVWETEVELTMAAERQTVTLPAPTGTAPVFWRAVAR